MSSSHAFFSEGEMAKVTELSSSTFPPVLFVSLEQTFDRLVSTESDGARGIENDDS